MSDQGTLILRSDIFYQSAKLESPDLCGPAELDKSSSNPDAIRGQEQYQIDLNGGAQSRGGTSGNAINGVSPRNPNKEKYEQARKKEFGS